MGYTVYWKWKGGQRPDSWFSHVQKKVEERYQEALHEILTGDGNSLLSISLDAKAPRLKDKYFHESFCGSMLGTAEFEFCKTARKLYDLAVKKALVEAQRLSDNAWEITCDDGGHYTKDTVLRVSKDGIWIPEERIKRGDA
jgi:hypothetical protein